ncbi:hypothetical protein J7E88_30345 [Streptomyces sp. ISL-10]|uniref:hypothetical protein n=1 Tax=Streptomyces sp. ISL-10 TaxID=2819172 RepID=UPI001BE74909|nr:hypothetical protein [Streptomyces sp. ISL-10]MBT2369462.1 hypothetical protein [Streptomyces sp. ISL-10]
MLGTVLGRRRARPAAAVDVVAALPSAVPLAATPAVAAEPPLSPLIPAEHVLDRDAADVPAAGVPGLLRGDHDASCLYVSYPCVSYAVGSQKPYVADGTHSLHGTWSDTVARRHSSLRTTVVGMGDITGDGRPDPVVRDTAGKLLRFSGTGTGMPAGRVRIGTSGWAASTGLH